VVAKGQGVDDSEPRSWCEWPGVRMPPCTHVCECVSMGEGLLCLLTLTFVAKSHRKQPLQAKEKMHHALAARERGGGRVSGYTSGTVYGR